MVLEVGLGFATFGKSTIITGTLFATARTSVRAGLTGEVGGLSTALDFLIPTLSGVGQIYRVASGSAELARAADALKSGIAIGEAGTTVAKGSEAFTSLSKQLSNIGGLSKKQLAQGLKGLDLSRVAAEIGTDAAGAARFLKGFADGTLDIADFRIFEALRLDELGNVAAYGQDIGTAGARSLAEAFGESSIDSVLTTFNIAELGAVARYGDAAYGSVVAQQLGDPFRRFSQVFLDPNVGRTTSGLEKAFTQAEIDEVVATLRTSGVSNELLIKINAAIGNATSTRQLQSLLIDAIKGSSLGDLTKLTSSIAKQTGVTNTVSQANVLNDLSSLLFTSPAARQEVITNPDRISLLQKLIGSRKVTNEFGETLGYSKSLSN